MFLVLSVKVHRQMGVTVFNTTFNNISVTVSFIGGGNQSTQRKPLTNFIT
jgi:hypothetical protein